MKKILSFLYITLVLLFVYAPIILLLIFSFNESKSISLTTNLLDNFSIKPYLNLIEIEKIRSIIVDTLVLALLATVISTILGTLGAIGIFYNKKLVGKLVKNSSQIPVINAEIVTAISLALVFSMIGFGRSYFALLVGHIVICTPFVVLSVLPKLKQMDSSLYEAALDLGASPTTALFKVIIPEILPGIISGFTLALTLSLDDFMISQYLKPSNFETISTYVYSIIDKPKNAYFAELRALSSVIFFIMIAIVTIMSFKSIKKTETKY